MKSASTAVCTPQRSPATVGRVHRRDNSEVQLYLAKLRRLLPARPGARRLTKLEVIQSVIDYICDLQYCLEMPLEAMDASVKTTTTTSPSAECEERVAPPSESPMGGDDSSQLISTQVDADDEYLDDEEEMEEDDDEYLESSPAPTPASAPLGAASNEQGLSTPC